MTGYERPDERMVEWLRDGPWDPPDDLIESAVSYAQRHPRHEHRLAGLWRFIMSGIRLTPVQQRPAANRSLYIALATVAVVVVFAVGLVGVLGPLGPHGQQPGGGATSAPPSTSQPTSPVPARITGAMSQCETDSAPETSVVGDAPNAITQTRGHTLRCSLTSSDERLTGSVTWVYNGERIANDDVEAIWGTIRLGVGDGRWSGMLRGSHEDQGSFNMYTLAGVFVGGGDYEGLRVRWTLEPRGPRTAADLLEANFTFAGTIESVGTIPPDGTTLISGSSSCSSSGGTETVVGDVTQGRGYVLTCAGNAGSDPRLDGIGRTVVNGDRASDGSADMWGTDEITVDGVVTWAGEYSGTVAPGFTTHRLAGTDIGYGPYAGLVYEWTMIGDPDSGYVKSGSIRPAP